jgi:ribosomal-protein-alanine N-acetyltransferase
MGAALWSYAAHEAELEYVVVDATWRRQGWGCVLMQLSHAHLAHGAMDVRRFVLEVATKNLHAIVLYRALGYRQEGVRLRYYKDGQDALVMVRENSGHS